MFNRIRNQKEGLCPYNLLSTTETSDSHGVKSGRLNKSYMSLKPAYSFLLSNSFTRDSYVISCNIFHEAMKHEGKKETAEERGGTETTPKNSSFYLMN